MLRAKKNVFTLNSSISGLYIKKNNRRSAKNGQNRPKSVVFGYMMNISPISRSRKKNTHTIAYGLDKAFAVSFFNFVGLVVTLNVIPNDFQNPHFAHISVIC